MKGGMVFSSCLRVGNSWDWVVFLDLHKFDDRGFVMVVRMVFIHKKSQTKQIQVSMEKHNTFTNLEK